MRAVFTIIVGMSLPMVQALPAAESLPAQAEVQFKGTSTLHGFHGHVAAKPFTIKLPAVAEASPRTWSAKAELRIGEMTTENKDRDKNMFRMFGADQFPTIQATVENAVVPTNSLTQVEGKIRIRNTEKIVPITITNWKEDADGVSFHATFDVSLKSFGLKPPSVIGIIRVGDRVVVESDVKASPAAVTSQNVSKP